MANFTTYLEDMLIGLTVCQSPYTVVSTVYAALCTNVTSDGDSFTEIDPATGYGRLPIAFAPPVGRSCVNSPAVTWSTATTIWGGIGYVVLCDASSGGNGLYWIPLTTVQTVAAGNAYQIPQGQITVLMVQNFTTYTAQAILGHTLLGSAFTPPGTLGLGLLTSVTSNGDLVQELPSTGTGYGRQVIAFGTPVDGITQNSIESNFPYVTTPCGTVGWLGIYDTTNPSGNLLYWVPTTPNKYLDVFDGYNVPTSLLSLQLL